MDRAPSGYPGAIGGLRRLQRDAVHDLHRRRHDPRRDDARDRLARRFDRRERRELGDDDLWLPHDAKRDLDRHAERALGADDDAEQVRPVVAVDRLPAELEQLAVGEHDLRASHVVHGEPVLEAVGAAGVLGEVAADRADLLARGVGGVEIPLAGDCAGYVEVRHSGLDDDTLTLDVDLDDSVHPRERDDDAVRDRQRATREPRPRAAGDEGDAFAGAQAQHRLHLAGGAG